MKSIVSWDGDKIGKIVGQMTLHDDINGIRRINQDIINGNKIWESYAVSTGNNVVEIGGDSGIIEIDFDCLDQLPAIRRKYEQTVHATVSVGVGMKLSESAKALVAAKLLGGNQVVFYSPEVEEIIAKARQIPESEKIIDEFFKSEPLEKAGNSPDAPEREKLAVQVEHADKDANEHQKGKASKGYKAHMGTTRMGAFGATAFEAPAALAEVPDDDPNQAVNAMYSALIDTKRARSSIDTEKQMHHLAQAQHAQDDEDSQSNDSKRDELKAQIVAILQKVKEQAPVLEQIKQSAPDIYQSVMQMAQAVVLLGREVVGETSMAKSEPEELEKREYLKAKLPVGAQLDPGPQGVRSTGKIKVRDKDGNERWISVRSGMVMGKDGHAVSSLRPLS